MDLYEQITKITNQLESSVGLARKYDLDYAEKEKNYRIALSQRLTQLRAEGQAVTHLADIVRGEEQIANLRFQRDVAEGMRNSARETINYLKLKLRILDSQLEREWRSSQKNVKEWEK